MDRKLTLMRLLPYLLWIRVDICVSNEINNLLCLVVRVCVCVCGTLSETDGLKHTVINLQLPHFPLIGSDSC